MRAMKSVDTQAILVDGSPVQRLDVVYIFKGKLHAAAGRLKVSDAADLSYLVDAFEEHLRNYTGQFSSRDIGNAVRRYSPTCYVIFSTSGQCATNPAADTTGAFDVQRGIIE